MGPCGCWCLQGEEKNWESRVCGRNNRSLKSWLEALERIRSLEWAGWHPHAGWKGQDCSWRIRARGELLSHFNVRTAQRWSGQSCGVSGRNEQTDGGAGIENAHSYHQGGRFLALPWRKAHLCWQGCPSSAGEAPLRWRWGNPWRHRWWNVNMMDFCPWWAGAQRAGGKCLALQKNRNPSGGPHLLLQGGHFILAMPLQVPGAFTPTPHPKGSCSFLRAHVVPPIPRLNSEYSRISALKNRQIATCSKDVVYKNILNWKEKKISGKKNTRSQQNFPLWMRM